MFGWFRKDKAAQKSAADWYVAIMAKSREPEPYLSGWIEDTLEGRFQMVTMVSTLVMRRLRDFGDEGRTLADGIYKNVFSGVDHALREEGVGDSSIARKVRKMGEEFFGLARAMDATFESSETSVQMTETLKRNVQSDADKAAQLADWVIALDAELQEFARDAALSGQAPWSDAVLQG